MNGDFHFYGTFLAARAAGWSVADATTIANSAAFIDHYSVTAADAVGRVAESFDVPFSPRFTFPAHDTDWFSSVWSMRQENSTWTVFHFLPGNRPTGFDGPKYRPVEVEDWGLADTGGRESGEGLTRPHGGVARVLLERLAPRCREDVHLLGIAAHVFEDTWAHQNFSGRALQLNVKADNEDVQAIDRTTGQSRPLGLTLSSGPTQQAPYLGQGIPGHGRFGMAPDLAFLRWSYRPRWSGSSEPLVRDNPSIFLDAWDHVAAMLWAVRTGHDLLDALDHPPQLPSAYREVVERFVAVDMWAEWKDSPDFETFEARCMDTWRQLAGDLVGDAVYTAQETWVRQAEAVQSALALQASDVFRFNQAAECFWDNAWQTLRDLDYRHTIRHFSRGVNKVLDDRV